jgi:hypothetical protein
MFYLSGALTAPGGSIARETELLLAAAHKWLALHLEEEQLVWSLFNLNPQALRTYLRDKSLVPYFKL